MRSGKVADEAEGKIAVTGGSDFTVAPVHIQKVQWSESELVLDMDHSNVDFSASDRPSRRKSFPKRTAHWFHKKIVSFVVVLFFLVATAAILPTITALAMSFVSTNRWADTITSARALSHAQSLRLSAKQQLTTAETVVAINKQKVLSGVLSQTDQVTLNNSLYGDFYGWPVSAVWITFTQPGVIYGHIRYDNVTGYWRGFNNGTECELSTNLKGQWTGSSNWCKDNYGGTGKPWYTIVSDPAGPQKCWTDMYTSSISGITYISHSLAVRDNTGYLIAVSGMDYIVGAINVMFTAIPLPENSIAFIITQDGLVVGCSSPDVQLYDENNQVLPVSDVQHWLIQDAVSFYNSHTISWVEDEYTAWISGSHVMAVTPLQMECGINWGVVVVYQGEKMQPDILTLVLCCVICAACLGLALLFSLCVSRPLKSLERDMRSITHLDFTGTRSPPMLTEMREIHARFAQLKSGIIALTKYIPRKVVLDVMHKPIGSSLLGMEQRRMTVLFCDIKGFTTLSESLPRHSVVALLNEWLEGFTVIIHQNHGTIDKYIGDCIMAIWGAPEEIEEQEFWACKTAVDFMRELEHLNQIWASRGMPGIEIRVGIHTGVLLVGNIGCPDRINYTVCGNTANIASRLEQLGKVNSLTPLISGETYRTVKDQFVCAWVDTVILRGYKTTVTHVYQLIGTKAGATGQQIRVAQLFNNIYDGLLGGDKSTVEALIQECKSDTWIAKNYAIVLERVQRRIQGDEAPTNKGGEN
ncbi:adenylate/guanilate cyclase [Pelomyxa schiedti]|nr:adenylate/guanilate cyclase [Pelomyxa schiedti]